MAKQTVLADGPMLKQIGAAQLGVTAPAQLVHRILLDQCSAGRMMRIVAGRTAHLTVSDGVRRGLEAVGPLLRVTGKADIRLLREQRHGIHGCVRPMAVRTGDLVTLVHTSGPGDADVSDMAVCTYLVLFLDGRVCTATEIDNRWMPGTNLFTSRMFFPRAMAALTLQVRKRRLGVTALSMWRSEDE
jgi:hypothetical protein